MVRPAYFRRDGMFTPWLRQPLPVPVFSGGEEVWMTVSVDEEELQSFGGLYRQTMAGRFPYVLPVLLLLAGQLAMVFFLTPSILLDWAIYTGIVLAGAAGLSLLICGLLHTMGAAGTRTVQLAFTPSGLALRRGETVSFIDRSMRFSANFSFPPCPAFWWISSCLPCSAGCCAWPRRSC